MTKLILACICLIILSCNSRAQNDTHKSSESAQHKIDKVTLTGKQVVDELDHLSFFNLTAKEDLAESKLALAKSYKDFNLFDGYMKGDSLVYTDNRFYIIDAETLFEVGGLTEYLYTVKVTFDKLQLKLVVSDEYSKQTEKHWTHTIKLNGKKYTAFDHDFSDLDWGISFVTFIEMLNDQLQLQHSTERFYPISSGNDGKIVLLTPEQYEFVKANYPNDIEHPKTLSDWKTSNGL